MRRETRTAEEAQILSVLDAIALNAEATQRELSRTTGLNLAKVNFLLKRLAEKGFVKLRNVSRNPNKLGYLYILTPQGLSEKSRLTVRFAARTWQEYSRTVDRLGSSLLELAGLGVARVALLGANEVAGMVLEASAGVPEIEVVGIVDPRRAGESRRGVPVVARAGELEFDRAIPCDQTEEGLAEYAEKVGVEEDRLWLV
jgi:EPS-associated MarR family transcriptional regulator